MQNETALHKAFTIAQEAWPIISGLFLVMVAGTKLWWKDRKDTKHRIKNLEVLAERVVLEPDLHRCREDVRKADERNMEKLTAKLKDIHDQSEHQYSEIMNHIIKLSGKK